MIDFGSLAVPAHESDPGPGIFVLPTKMLRVKATMDWSKIASIAGRLSTAANQRQVGKLVADAIEDLLGDVELKVYFRGEDRGFKLSEKRRCDPAIVEDFTDSTASGGSSLLVTEKGIADSPDRVSQVLIAVSAPNKDYFRQDAAPALKLLALVAALRIQHLRLARQSETFLKQSVKLGNKIAKNLDPNQVSRAILEEGSAITGCPRGHIRIYEKENDGLILLEKLGPRTRSPLDTRRPGEGLSGHVFKTGIPEFISDIAHHPLRDQVLIVDKLRNRYPIKAMVSFPLIVEDEKIGVLNLHSPNRIRFDREKRAVFQDLAARSAVALRAALQHKAAKKDIQRVQDIGTNFARTRELAPLLDAVLISALEFSGVEAGTFRLYDETRSKWVLRAVHDRKDKGIRSKIAKELKFTEGGFLDAGFPSGKIQFLGDENPLFEQFKKDLDPKHKGFLRNIQSIAVAPVGLQEKRLGVLVLLSRKHKISESSLGFLPLLVSFAAVAIDNATKQRDETLLLMAEVLDSYLHELKNTSLGLDGTIAAKQWGAVKQKARRLSVILDDVPELGRGQGMSFGDDVELYELVETSLSRFSFSPGITLVRPVRGNSEYVVRGNGTLLRQVLRRILENTNRVLTPLVAKKSQDPKITVSLRREEEQFCISIEDKGPGMNEELTSRVFESFSKGPGGGQGIGLFCASKFVRYHGGLIEVKSELGQGTTFEIYLPAKRAKPHA